MQTALIILHMLISVALIVVVLLQHGKQQGLSGAIAGGAETFFGKNKGRTVDAMLRKFTTVLAALFIITSISLAVISINNFDNSSTDGTGTGTQQDASQNVSVDANGNIVDQNGNPVLDENGNPYNINTMQTEDQNAGDASQPADNSAASATSQP